MAGRLEHLIKFNPIANKLYTAIASACIRLLGCGNPIQENLILFSSDIGKNYTGSPKAIYELMRETGMLEEMDAVWAFVDPERFRDMLGCKVIKIDSIDYFRMALRAKYWITDVNIERGLQFKRNGTRYLNTWHGTSLKTLGFDIHNRIYYDCSSIDCMCASSSYDVDTFSRAFKLPREKFILTGLPRNDKLYSCKDTDSRNWKALVGLPEDKRVILYAPTWRDTNDGGSTYTIKPPINIAKWKQRLSDDSVLVFRMHPLTQKAYGIKEDDFIRDYSSFQPLNDLLLASDCLITDYSSLAFDYAILRRPVLCFGYDAKEYSSIRGLYLDVDKVFPQGNMETEDELLEALVHVSEWGDGEYEAPLYVEFNEYGGAAAQSCLEALLL